MRLAKRFRKIALRYLRAVGLFLSSIVRMLWRLFANHSLGLRVMRVHLWIIGFVERQTLVFLLQLLRGLVSALKLSATLSLFDAAPRRRSRGTKTVPA